MPGREAAARSGGFTIMELLVALILMAILLSFLGRSMSQIILGQKALQDNIMSRQSMVTLRRVLHRDIQGLWNPKTMVVNAESIEFTTSNCLATPHPLNVRVEWALSPVIMRTETIDDMDYRRELLLMEGVLGASLEFYIAEEERWIDLQAFLLDPKAKKKYFSSMRAVRLTLELETSEVTIVERFPHDELL